MKKLFVLAVFVSFAASLCAQSSSDPVIFEINGKPIYKSEFMREFLRSVGKDPKAAPTACTYEKRQALEEYVVLFVNFRAKLEDAYVQGYDTMPTLRKELKGYRDELAAPYLIDSVTMLNILHEAYERNQYVLNAAHILVKLNRNATPEDTLKAYNEAMAYYNRVKSGEDFFAVALEANNKRMDRDFVAPDDPRRNDDGNLGNFTVFDMVYPFESAAYALQPGEISLPVRTNYGYHIIKLISKTPYFGKTTFQHIWCSMDAEPYKTEQRAHMAYESINAGRSFSSVCADYSDDNSTSLNGGLLRDLAPNQIPPEYVEHLAKMKPGEVSEPFKTKYGWHIILLNHRDSIPAFDDMVPYYKQRMVRDIRSTQPKAQFIEQCKKKYNLVDYTKVVTKVKKGKKTVNEPAASLQECVAAVNDSVFDRMWKYRDGLVTDMRPLCSIGDTAYTAVDFLKYVASHQHAEQIYDLDQYIQNRYNSFLNDMVFEYADTHLEAENPEFAALIEEYRRGLMIFSYNEQMVWSKAIWDTVGYAEFYDRTSKERDINNEADEGYFWNERATAVVVTVGDSSFIAPNKLSKLVDKAAKKNWDNDQLLQNIQAKGKKDAKYRLEEEVVEKGHQNLLNSSQWKPGVFTKPLPRGYQMIWVKHVAEPCLKSPIEARGYYLNDYQTYLDNQLIDSLRKKYNVIIHQDVIDEITY